LNQKKFYNLIFATIIALFFTSCGNDSYTPKPHAYFRIDLPKKTYKKFDTTYPYSFEYPAYSLIIPDTNKLAEPYWINVAFPRFRGIINISYKPIKNDLVKFTEDARMFANKHITKATAINEKRVDYKDAKVHGLIYDIEGTAAASSFQFVLTDSTKNFIRAALYFYARPNNDSLAPVLDFVKQDIYHLIETFRWKEVAEKKKK
jgi:gliding motility-associated lipoprotein GldD